MQNFFRFLSQIIQLYYWLCFFRIILSWFPRLNYSPVMRMLSSLTDPFLNIFRKLPLQAGSIDFSPMIAFFVLSALSSIIQGIAVTGRLYVAQILSLLISMLWNLIFSFISFILILIIIRLISLAINRNKIYYNSPWTILDQILSRFSYNFAKIFTGTRNISYTTSLIIFLIELIIISVAGNLLFVFLRQIIYTVIPF